MLAYGGEHCEKGLADELFESYTSSRGYTGWYRCVTCQKNESMANDHRIATVPTFQPSNLPTFQPSCLPAFLILNSLIRRYPKAIIFPLPFPYPCDRRRNLKHEDLNDEERKTYEWQMWVEDFGEEGQLRLKNTSVLISRIGGLGGVVAYELAAAGVGRLVLAHAGKIKHSDLNRQLLMTHAALGTSRVESARARLLELNPRLDIVTVPDNVTESNASELVQQADIVVDCAPLFEERFALNREIVRQRKPMVECAMYDLEAHITTIVPGKTPCLNCLYPGTPPAWRRQFPVFGAVSGMVGCMGAMEAVKLAAGFGKPLTGSMMICDLRGMTFRQLRLQRQPDCPTCSGVNCE